MGVYRSRLLPLLPSRFTKHWLGPTLAGSLLGQAAHLCSVGRYFCTSLSVVHLHAASHWLALGYLLDARLVSFSPPQ